MNLQLRRATVVQRLGKAPEGLAGVYLATVNVADVGEKTAYVKPCSPREIAIEALCALLARACGLQTPDPAVAIDALDGGAPKLCFASVAQPVASLAQRFARPVQAAWVAKWKDANRCACFDELIANVDRHGGNILWVSADDCWIIDHDRAVPAGFPAPMPTPRNQLFEVLRALASDETAKQETRALAHHNCDEITAAQNASLPSVAAAVGALGVLHAHANELEKLLAERVRHLHRLCQHWTPANQMGLIGGP